MKMKMLETIALKLFQLFCIFLVLLLTYQQFWAYLSNQDSSSVSYRKFNVEEKDIYPTFSICLYSNNGGILKQDSKLFGMKGSEGVDLYHNMLIGHENVTSDLKKIEFDKSCVDILDEFVDISFSHTKQGEQIHPWHHATNTINESPFYKSYHDPYFRCITKSMEYVKHQILDYDFVMLNASKLYEYMKNNTGNLLVYIHHPGQLVREFRKQIFQLTLQDFQKAMNNSNNFRDIHLNQVEVLRKRYDGSTPCNDSLANDDRMWLETVMTAVNCIPSYWKGLYHLQESNLPECNSKTQYKDLNQYYLPPNNIDNGTILYEEPCNQMRITTSVITNDYQDNHLVLGFRYAREEYRETNNYRAFGKQSTH